MNMNKSSKITRVASTFGILLGAFALSVFATNTWTPAPNAPSACDSSIPGCNTPLNVAAGAQSKVGGALYLNTRFFTFGGRPRVGHGDI